MNTKNTKNFILFLMLVTSLLHSSLSYAEKPLPLRKPHNIIGNTNFYFAEGGGVSVTYDYAVTENIAPGAGIGLTAGETYFQYIIPIYINFYPISSIDYNHRFLIVVLSNPFYQYDENIDFGGVALGASGGYEYRNEHGNLFRLTAGVLIPLSNHAIGQPVLGHFRLGLGFSI